MTDWTWTPEDLAAFDEMARCHCEADNYGFCIYCGEEMEPMV